MLRCHDRDAEAEQNIAWTRKRIDSVRLGTAGGSWDNGGPKASDAGAAFRNFSKKEMEEVRGSVSEEVQKDLRSVHWRYGFNTKNVWESEAERLSKNLPPTSVPQRSTKNLQNTQFKLGCRQDTPLCSGSNADHRVFSKQEIEEVRGVLADSVKKDLRAVHFFAPHGKNDWQSTTMGMAKMINGTHRPEKMTKDLRTSHIYLGEDHVNLRNISDSHCGLREFSKTEMDEVRGSMAEEVQADLRAVHFKLGNDRGVLDRHIRDRRPQARSRPQSAGCSVRPRSALGMHRRPSSAAFA